MPLSAKTNLANLDVSVAELNNDSTLEAKPEEEEEDASKLSEEEEEAEYLAVVSSVASVPSEVEADKCVRKRGQICICESCETSRSSMLNRKRRKTESDNTVDAKRKATDAIKLKSDSTQIVAASSIEHEAKIKIMSAACKTILECIGEDPNREGLVKTPERWAKALLYMCSGYQQTPEEVTNGAVFQENHEEMVVVRNIDIHSLCEHHMVPFSGRVHIGYIPNGKILGLSKLARIAELYARRLQVQERLTRQIADAIVETVEPLGVAVVVECTHFCMVMRGVEKTGAVTTTSSVRGCFESNPKTRAEFFSIIHGNSVKMC